MERIRIDQIVTDRDIDAAEPLPSDPEILRLPIVVSAQDMVLIDGLRRLKHHRDNGTKTIATILVRDVDQAFEALTPQHEGRTLKPRQMWNILRIVYPWGLRESAHKRAVAAYQTKLTGVSHRTPREEGTTPLRMRMVKMLNASSGHVLERTLYLYRAVEAGNPVAIEMAREVDDGKRGIYSASAVVARGNLFRGSIKEHNEQKTLLENGSRNLGAQVGALLKLGSPVLVDSEDLELFIQALSTSRSKLATFINQLKAVQRERTHG